ncbi:hypothetical protein [Rhizohabitans arisaemae]|uniref:hypothetical protein n=1 Tax=Rhizohabitans arisaemae TaxID=2720610 RepID=UPI0024B17939|nr:hypothetical protein [Rhizohabitans arisaemae]
MLLMFGLTVAVPAHAATEPPAPEIGGFTAEPVTHCVKRLGEGARTTCHTSFREAISVATDGRIPDAPEDARSFVKDPVYTARVNELGTERSQFGTSSASLIVSIEYQLTGHRGLTLTYTNPTPCTSSKSDVEFSDDLTGDGWDNKISAFQGYNGCYVNHFQLSGFGGESTGFRNGSGNLGWMDNRTTSLLWT